MEYPLLASSSNTTSFAISNMDIIDQYIPQELQMPFGIAAVSHRNFFIATFLLFLSTTTCSTFFLYSFLVSSVMQIVVLIIAIILGVTQKKGESKAEVTFKSPGKSAKISKSGTPMNQKTGTVLTPAGRRSARLARRKAE